MALERCPHEHCGRWQRATRYRRGIVQKHLTEQAHAAAWTKCEASEAITSTNCTEYFSTLQRSEQGRAWHMRTGALNDDAVSNSTLADLDGGLPLSHHALN